MLSRKHASLLGLALLLATGIASAEDEEDEYAQPGPYLHGALIDGYGEFKGSDDGRLGFDLILGHRFQRYFAAEVEFQAVPDWKIRGVEQTTYGMTANAKGFLPMGRFQPFARFGLGVLITEKNDNVGVQTKERLAVRFGVGADVFVWERASVGVSYGYTGDLNDYGYTALYWRIGYQFAGE